MRQSGSIVRKARRTLRAVASRGLPIIGGLRARGARKVLLTAGAIDADWVGLQLGLLPGALSIQQAAARYLAAGPRLDLAPLPTFEPGWYAATTRGRGPDPVVTYLTKGPGTLGAHPLVAEIPGSTERLAIRLAHRTSAVLPTPAGWPVTTVGDLRDRLVPLLVQVASERDRSAGRITHTWDAAAERGYLATLRDLVPVRAATTPGELAPNDIPPMVSIVLPVRNRPTQILAAIASVQAQNYPDWELLVIDDGSTDPTPDVVATAAASDSRIKLLRLEHGGVCLARNAGIAAASGRYVAFLDSDNTWRSHYLGTMLAAMVTGELPVAYAVIHEQGNGGSRYRVGQADVSSLALGNVVDLNVLVVRTELLREIGGFDPSLRRMVDYDLAWRLAQRAPLTLLPFVGVDYDADPDASDRISTTESFGWDDVVRTRHTVDLVATAARIRPADLVSVVIPATVYAPAAATVAALFAGSSDVPLEVIVVDSGTAPGVARLLHGALPSWPGLRVIRVPRDLHRAGSFNIGLAASTGATVVFVDEGMVIDSDDLASLTGALRSPQIALASVQGHGPRVAAARATELLTVAGMNPIFLLQHEVQDLAARLTQRTGGAHLEVALPQVQATSPARQPTPAMISDNDKEFARSPAART